METVQLQCGHCRKVMAIGVEHLGGQVQCPHCRGVVQTPPRTPPAAPPPPAPVANHEVESIFAGPEASDAAIGEQAAPKVELPPSAETSGVSEPAAPDADLTKFKPRPIYTKSVLAMYGFIFLIPYAILTTMAVLYLLLSQGGKSAHPFDMLPDPVPNKAKGGPKQQALRIPHDLPLAAHQKVALGKSIKIGDLLVTPERVMLTDDDDLKLFLRAKNVSANTVFEPINGAYIHFVPGKDDEPYSYIEAKSGVPNNIYDADYAYLKSAKNGAEEGSGSLGPQEETTIALLTGLRYKSNVSKIARSTDSYTWRVQLRRGFVKWKGKDVSATAVIGVEFTSAQIEREK
jgi:hypothetical protein